MSGAKSSGRKADVTVDEAVALLQKTCLPTVIVEGADDIIVYRRLEERLGHLGLSVLPVGGREKVLGIFDRRHELPGSLNLAFIADKDTWVYTDVPPNYKHPNLIFTTGYSIENDVFVDGDLVGLLVGRETHSFSLELASFIRWYALALSRHLIDCTNSIAHHPDYVLNPIEHVNLTSLVNDESFPQALYDDLMENYQYKLRGKSLMALLIRTTNHRLGQPRHSTSALMEIVAARPGNNLRRVASEVQELLTA